MKQIILTLAVLLIFIIGLKSQNYVPFPTENVHWNVFYAGTCQEKAPDSTILRYTIQGDTVINEVSYKKLCLESGNTINPKIRAIGGIREENKQIFYNGETIYTGTDNKEYLLYDFTKQIGDTIKHHPQGWFYSVILDIDSVLIDDVYRKRYEADNHWFYQNPDYIVEGIGSVKNGLLGHISDIPTCGTHYWEFICFRESNEVKYLNPAFTGCVPDFLLMGSNLTLSNLKIKVYPNPVDQDLYIEKYSNENLSLKIIDINGRSIIERQISEIKTTIKLVKPGVYNVLITDKAGQIILTKKILRQ